MPERKRRRRDVACRADGVLDRLAGGELRVETQCRTYKDTSALRRAIYRASRARGLPVITRTRPAGGRTVLVVTAARRLGDGTTIARTPEELGGT